MLIQGTILQNRYQIIQRLGGGGMGDVYLAADLRLGNNRVVVKENRGGDPQLFQTEATILAVLQHPNLPRVIDHFVEPPPPASTGAQYLVMDYIAGQNLEQMVQARGLLPEGEVLGWFRQILDAVKYLHANRIIHRDIKPQNIIITPSGRAMLVDFGIAKVMQPGRVTASGARGWGSPGYAPPEQYTGGTDERSDVYSLGATMYFALTGIEPPSAPERAYGKPLISICQRNPSVAPRTEQVIFQAMTLAGAQRYPSIAAMEQALWLLPMTPAPPPPSPPPPPGHKRAWGWLAVAAIVVCALIFGVQEISQQQARQATAQAQATASAQAQETVTASARIQATATAQAQATATAQVRATAQARETATAQAIATAQTATPTGGGTGKIAFFSYRTGNDEIYLMNADGSGLQQLTNGPGLNKIPVWSLDGKRIAFSSLREGRWDIWTMDATGGNLSPLTTDGAEKYPHGWSSDGRSFAYDVRKGDRFVIIVKDIYGSESKEITLGEGWTSCPAWSPDGNKLLITYWHQQKRDLYVAYLYDGRIVRLTNSGEVTGFCGSWSPDGSRIAFPWKGDIYTMKPDGTDWRQLTRQAGNNFDPFWSPDGRMLVFISDRDGNNEVYVMNSDGSGQRRLTNHPANDGWAVWQPRQR